jgi:hypothetical protein
MSVSNDSTGIRTIDDGRALLSSTFLEFCAKVRNNDPSIMPEVGKPFEIRYLRKREYTELADALLENTSVTYLQLDMEKHTKSSAEAMANKYVRTSKCLQRIRWNIDWNVELNQREEVLCCFLTAIQESTTLKELQIKLPLIGGQSNLTLDNMLTQIQSSQSLRISRLDGPLDGIAMAAAMSGLKKNTTLRELTLEFLRGATAVSPIFTSLRDHPLLQRLCVRGHVVDLTGLETVLLSDNSKITELEIDMSRCWGIHTIGLTHVLQALGLRPTLAKLILRHSGLGRDQARDLGMALCNIPSLHSLVLTQRTLGSARLAELSPALYHNTSIKVQDVSWNFLNDMESAGLLRDILRRNKTITTLNLAVSAFGKTTGAVECIADGLGWAATQRY